MPLTPGTRLGPYEIVSALGAGGMGEVYRAIDTKLKRQVAIKILPASLAGDRDRLARFQREAEVLASLNHPNIAGIYGIEETHGSQALIMELVEGEDLSALIASGPTEAESGSSRPRDSASAARRESPQPSAPGVGPRRPDGRRAPRNLSLDDALAIAKQIAEALAAAHELGIIHRDLKPANIKVRADGTVKVLDFGLAKALDPAGASRAGDLANSPTITSPAMTQMGMILGTAAYMSPEQARGRAVDKRADIWAFGAVLYEMLTGTRAFPGEDTTDTLAAVVRAEPDWTLLPRDLSPTLGVLLRRCLQKDPKQRIGDIHDVRLALEGAFDFAAPPSPAPIVAPTRPLWKRAMPVLAAVIATAGLTSAGLWYVRPATPPTPVVRFPLTLAEGSRFTGLGRLAVAISPDGTQIAYLADQRLYLRAMSETEARIIPGMDIVGNFTSPVFSPDGRYLAFYSSRDRTLKKIPVSGGVALTLCPAGNPYGMSWSDDGIAFGQASQGVMRVSANGGAPDLLARVEPGEIAHGPQLLPGGQTFMYTLTTGPQWDQARVVVQSIEPGSAPRTIIENGADARYVPTGHLVYAQGGTLMAVPFDLERLQVIGARVTVVEGVLRSVGGATGTAQFDVSRTGSLVYIPGPISTVSAVGRQRVLAGLDPQGELERLKVPAKGYAFPRVSPDGKWIAVSTDDGNDSNVWIIDRAGAAAPRQLTLGGANRYPVWSADGERVAFQSDREGDLGIFWQRADGTGAAERLTRPERGVAHIPDSWSPDGTRLALTALKGRDGALWILSLEDKTATVFAEKPSSSIGRAAFSPDGRWLAYQSNETGGQNQIFVQPFPATGAKYLITGGGHPFWSPDGRELVINPGAGRIETVRITTQPNFSFGEPTPRPGGLAGLNSKDPSLEPRVWDFAPDGKRLIGVADPEGLGETLNMGIPSHVQVVVNWFEDLTQRMAAQ